MTSVIEHPDYFLLDEGLTDEELHLRVGLVARKDHNDVGGMSVADPPLMAVENP